MSNKEEKESILRHQGNFVYALLWCPPVETFTISKGFSDDKIKKLSSAVKTVVVNNPILSGCAKFVNNKEIYITPGYFDVDKHDFVNIIDAPEHMTPPATFPFDDNSQKKNIDFITNNIVPLVSSDGPSNAGEEMKKRTPLFCFTIIRLKEDVICYRLKVSHIIGDASTYYMIMDQISSTFNNNETSTERINWYNPLVPKGNTAPEEYSKRDVNRSTGIPTLIGVLSKLHTLLFRKIRFVVVPHKSTTFLKKKKDLLNSKTNNSFLSTNDIIMSALCQSNTRSSIAGMVMSDRGRKSGIGKQDGGNLHTCVLFKKTFGKDPNNIRHIVQKGAYYKPNTVPLFPFLRGRQLLCSNWSSVTRFLKVDGAVTICHMPHPSFIKGLPVDVAIIFAINENNTGVCYNFKEKKGCDLQTLLA